MIKNKILIAVILLNIFAACARTQIHNPHDFKKKIKIGYWSSWKIKCGIAMYTEHLYNSLKKSGYQVFAYSNKTPIKDLLKQIKEDKIDILNIQYEAGLYHWANTVMKNLQEFVSVIKKIKMMGVKIVMTMHMERKDSDVLVKLADQCIYHRPSAFFKSSKINLIPIGVPVFEPRIKQKDILRKEFGFSKEDKIITTMGFMLEPKRYPDILNVMVHFLKRHKNIKVQLLTSFTNREVLRKQSLTENKKIKKVIKDNNLQDQVIHITKFLPQSEVAERLWISDLGYIWGDSASTASSASIKEFISARLPFVANDCKRYSKEKIPGMIKTINNKYHFVNQIMLTLNYGNNLNLLRNKLEGVYQSLNYDKILEKHLHIFYKTIKFKQI